MKISIILSSLLGVSVLAAPVNNTVETQEPDETLIDEMLPTNGTVDDIDLNSVELIGEPVFFSQEEKRSAPSYPGSGNTNYNYNQPSNGNYNQPSGSAGSFLSESEYKDKLLAVHNKVREAHGVPALKWSSDLVSYGQRNTPTCQFGHTPSLGRDRVGENILMGGGAIDQMAMQMWYTNELKQYNFGRQGFSMATGHMTQMVWKSTTEVGCAVKKCGSSSYVKCNYRTPGNMQGAFEQNVNPPRNGASYTPSTPSQNNNNNNYNNSYQNKNQNQNQGQYQGNQGSNTYYSNGQSNNYQASRPANNYNSGNNYYSNGGGNGGNGGNYGYRTYYSSNGQKNHQHY
ncbi:hypothetical protein H072_6286 [Dactylellina haptotyla CBS 200.50]|uniref:SCP domain-containing protein n=1 Tax=Dactylellina haptotyla (strain CBS 200.50) TaxID=1284197 RepID=S8AA99_DACHA|nr:hypothetical protein H072_6286 [Dactylellina haptotyla CBS 200.50]